VGGSLLVMIVYFLVVSRRAGFCWISLCGGGVRTGYSVELILYFGAVVCYVSSSFTQFPRITVLY